LKLRDQLQVAGLKSVEDARRSIQSEEQFKKRELALQECIKQEKEVADSSRNSISNQQSPRTA
jgi:hypothetical protein